MQWINCDLIKGKTWFNAINLQELWSQLKYCQSNQIKLKFVFWLLKNLMKFPKIKFFPPFTQVSS